jgi:hypothetical protein
MYPPREPLKLLRDSSSACVGFVGMACLSKFLIKSGFYDLSFRTVFSFFFLLLEGLLKFLNGT